MQKARRHPNGAPTACRRTVSGSVSLRCPRCFSPFPHGTCPLSVSRECLALADGAAGFGQGSSGPALLRVRTGLDSVSHTGLSPSPAGLSRPLPLPSLLPCRPPCNPARAATRAVWAVPLSLAATRGVTVVFLSSAYLDVSVRRVSLRQRRMARLPRAGFPHSDIRGSQAVRASPRLFAACRVLHRLREPGHPPCALRYLPRTAPVRRNPCGRTPSILALSHRSSCMPDILAVLDFSCLSFHPVKEPPPRKGHVENKGVEPLTPSLQSWCSSQLS